MTIYQKSHNNQPKVKRRIKKDDIVKIIDMHLNGIPMSEIQTQFNITPKMASKISRMLEKFAK